MTADRVRQALSIVAQMARTPGWIYRLNGARARLAGRLAVLGHLEEARRQEALLDGADSFHGHWRATLTGYLWGGERLAGRSPTPADLPDELDLLQVFAQMTRVSGPPSPAEREAWRVAARRVRCADDAALLSSWVEAW